LVIYDKMDYGSSYQDSGGAMASSFSASSSNIMSETEFQRVAQTVGTNVQKILQNVSSIQRMIAQIGTPQDNQQFQQQLHQIQHYTGQLAKDTAKHLGELNSSSAVGDNRQWRLQKERLHSDFTKALNSFQGAQRTAAQREKEAIKRARGAAGTVLPRPPSGTTTQTLTDTEETSAAGSGFGQGSASRTQMLLEEEDDMAQLQDRERSIRQLESDIVDVNTIFKDLATMVHEQGTMVDSIEQNVESTDVRVHEGTEQLRQAETYRNRARKKKFILCLIGVILLIILIIIIATNVN